MDLVDMTEYTQIQLLNSYIGEKVVLRQERP